MRKHLELVGMLYVVWGGLFVLIGVALLALAFGTASIVTSAEEMGGVAVGVAAAVFGTLASFSLIWGVAHVWDGVAIRRYRPAARAIAIVLAVLNLFLLPFGTALGIYALWVLTHEESRPMFATAQ